MAPLLGFVHFFARQTHPLSQSSSVLQLVASAGSASFFLPPLQAATQPSRTNQRIQELIPPEYSTSTRVSGLGAAADLHVEVVEVRIVHRPAVVTGPVARDQVAVDRLPLGDSRARRLAGDEAVEDFLGAGQEVLGQAAHAQVGTAELDQAADAQVETAELEDSTWEHSVAMRRPLLA